MFVHKHVVILCLENRSFLNLFGFLDNSYANNAIMYEKKRGYPFTNVDSKQEKISSYKAPETILQSDPGETFEHVKIQLGTPDSNGNYPMNGFVRDYEHVLRSRNHSEQESKTIMACIDPQRIPVLTKLAQTFVLCDNYFCSLPTQTWPNRCCFHAGSSGNQMNNRPYTHWFTQSLPTLFDQLEEKKIDFKIYFDERDVLSLTFLIHYRSLHTKQSHFWNHTHLFEDFAKNTLPTYSFVEPRFLVAPTDFHPIDSDNLIPGHNSVQAGEYFVAQLYNAWKNSPGRDDTLLIFTFDEHGGTSDFVSPPQNWGLRVPTLFVSTHFTRAFLRTHICSTLLQHLSILKSMHHWWNLDYLTEMETQCNRIPDYLFQPEISLTLNQLPNISSLHNYNYPLEEKLHLETLPSRIGTQILETLCLLGGGGNVENIPNLNSRVLLLYFKQYKQSFQWFSHLEKKENKKKTLGFQGKMGLWILLIVLFFFLSFDILFASNKKKKKV